MFKRLIFQAIFFQAYCSLLLLHCSLALASEEEPLSGYFFTIWGDSSDNQTENRNRYFLSTETSGMVELLIPETVAEEAGNLLHLNRRWVTVSTETVMQKPRTAIIPKLIVQNIEESTVHREGLTQEDFTGSKPWITIMCKFADVANEPENLYYFQEMYGDSYPGLNHYWREASYNRMDIDGSRAIGWHTLPHPRSSYIINGELDIGKLSIDCTTVSNHDVYFPEYAGINMMFNDNLDGYAWGGSWEINIDGQEKRYATTWIPPWGYQNITILAHEMGHGFGMPHSSGSYGQTYDNVWDVMSDAWANCSAATHITFGCIGQHTIGYHRDLAGWLEPDEIFTFDGIQAQITLQRITQPTSSGYLLAKIPISGSETHYYTVEGRKKRGYDTKLAQEGVIIHEVNELRPNGRDAYIIDSDNNGQTGDYGTIWTTGEMFTDTENSICISVTAATITGYSLQIGCDPQSPPNFNNTATALGPIKLMLLRQ